jgi:hypothetical protein
MMVKLQNSVSLLAILYLAAVLIPQNSLADDALISVYGGAAQMRDGKETEISMISETVEINLGKDAYTVDATFEFFNFGKTIAATVGFPKIGDPGKVGTLEDFQTWVNGKMIGVEEMPGVVLDGIDGTT